MVLVVKLVIQFFNQALVILGLGAEIYSDKYDISVLSGIAFEILFFLNLLNGFFGRVIILKFNQNKRLSPCYRLIH